MRTRFIAPLGACILALATVQASAQPYYHHHHGFEGRWTTSEGNMVVHQDEGHLSGHYDKRGGRVDGHVDYGHAEGVWSQDYADERCDTYRLGSRHWGRFEWRLTDDGQHFEGSWSYCDGPMNHSWTGDRAY